MRLVFALPLFLSLVAAAPTERDLEARGYPARCPAGQSAVSLGVALGTNGCSFVPDFAFTGSCNTHDRCYGTCSRTKRSCDDAFLTDMEAVCNSNYADAAVKRTACLAAAKTYHAGVAVAGDTAFENATKKHCKCV